jgi:hypothetical protein
MFDLAQGTASASKFSFRYTRNIPKLPKRGFHDSNNFIGALSGAWLVEDDLPRFEPPGTPPGGVYQAQVDFFTIPLWKFVANAMVPLTLIVFISRIPERFPASSCQKCGYDLRATPNQCPECGTVRAAPSTVLPVPPRIRHCMAHNLLLVFLASWLCLNLFAAALCVRTRYGNPIIVDTTYVRSTGGNARGSCIDIADGTIYFQSIVFSKLDRPDGGRFESRSEIYRLEALSHNGGRPLPPNTGPLPYSLGESPRVELLPGWFAIAMSALAATLMVRLILKSSRAAHHAPTEYSPETSR